MASCDGVTATTSSVSAEVSAGGAAAEATVSVARGPLPATAESAASARAWLLLAGVLHDSSEEAGARAAAEEGLSILGEAYLGVGDGPRDDAVEDSTELKLVAVSEVPDEGRRALGAMRVLRDRLELYLERHRTEQLSFTPALGDGTGGPS